ncbi:MAG: type II secretion system GspH family protein [Colwellia sp.]
MMILFVGRPEHSEARQLAITSRYKRSGFTLIELVLVIIILGVMSVGIASFMTLTTQTYLNVSERDELLASARFSVERLNREIRNVLPNSLRLTNANQCLQFTPIIESTIYTDIPVAPDTARNTMKVIKFEETFDSNWNAVVYPLTPDDVYPSLSSNVDKIHGVDSVAAVGAEWVITLDNSVVFAENSPTQRIYFVNGTVEYCLQNQALLRNGILMAQNINNINPFEISTPTLQRNALVQITLHFSRDGESIVFNNEVHLVNIP